MKNPYPHPCATSPSTFGARTRAGTARDAYILAPALASLRTGFEAYGHGLQVGVHALNVESSTRRSMGEMEQLDSLVRELERGDLAVWVGFLGLGLANAAFMSLRKRGVLCIHYETEPKGVTGQWSWCWWVNRFRVM